VLDIDVPMISAVNGPCNMHSEVPLLGDIVLASEDAYFQDASHFPRGQVPGDGQHVIWSFLAGHTVNVFKQNRIPDSGAAFFDMVAEPAV
jgi:enoyl-CoA hydratase/carnithine racemase